MKLALRELRSLLGLLGKLLGLLTSHVAGSLLQLFGRLGQLLPDFLLRWRYGGGSETRGTKKLFRLLKLLIQNSQSFFKTMRCILILLKNAIYLMI